MDYENSKRIELSDTDFLAAMFDADAPRVVVQFPERRGFVGLGAGENWKALAESRAETRYYCVSLFEAEPGVRRIEAFERQVVLVIDDIDEKAPASAFAELPAPTYKMWTSADSQQWGWVLTDTPAARDRGKLDHLLHHFVDRYFGSKDPGMLGVTRVVRTPGSWNMKESRRLPDGKNPRAKLYEFNPFARCSVETLAAAAGCNLAEAEDLTGVHGAPAEWPADAPIIKAIERGDIEVFREGREPGELIVACPNREQHTVDDDGHRSGKLYMKADGSGGYKCHHGGCAGFKFPQYLTAVGVKDEHDAWVNSLKFKDLIAQIPASPVETAPAAATPAPAPGGNRPEWRQAVDALHSMPDPTANTEALDGLLEAMLDLDAVEQAVAVSELRAVLKPFLPGPEFDKLVRRKRGSRGKNRAAAQRAVAAGRNALSAFVALPGEIDWPATGQQGDPLMHTSNVEKLVDHWGITLRSNRMTHTLEVNIPGVMLGGDDRESQQITYLKDIAKTSGMPAEGILEYLSAVAANRPFHPIVDMLSGMEWDGVDRFPRLLETIQSPHPDIVAKVMRRWMRQAIVAAFELHSTTPRKDVLTFLGNQSIGKTTFLQLLTINIPGAFRGGMHLDPTNKDSISSATSCWVCELGEVDSTFRKDIAALKAFISNTHDTLREPYAVKASTRPRRTVFTASVNEPEFLIDASGNSRFRVVEIEKINLDLMRQLVADGVIQKIWRQILAEVQAGAAWYFDQAENAELEIHSDQYRRQLPVEAAIHAVFQMDQPTDEWVEWSAADIHRRLEAAGHKVPLNQMAPGIRAAVKNHTGQIKAAHTRQGNVWRLPAIAAGGNVALMPPRGG